MLRDSRRKRELVTCSTESRIQELRGGTALAIESIISEKELMFWIPTGFDRPNTFQPLGLCLSWSLFETAFLQTLAHSLPQFIQDFAQIMLLSVEPTEKVPPNLLMPYLQL